jgi:hypothetical protein
MPAWLLPALLTAGGMGSSLWASGQRRNEFNRMMRMMQYYQSPKNILAETEGLYRGMLQSPMFSSAQGDVLSGARAAQSALQGRMVGSGVTGGMNVMGQALGAGLPGIEMGKLRSGMFANALEQTQRNIAGRLQMAGGTMGQPSGAETTLGSLFAALGPLLRQWMLTRRLNPGGQGSGMLPAAGWNGAPNINPSDQLWQMLGRP